MQRAAGALEHLDRAIAPAERDASLADIDRLNARFGGYSLTLRALDRLAAPPNVSLVRADASALPFRARAVDIVTMSLTLHHMEPGAAVTSLAEMSAAARTAVVVNDLLRSRLSLWLVWVATRVLGC